MTEYSASVSSKLLIDKDGTRLEGMNVDVTGFRDVQLLGNALDSYNKEELSENYKENEDDWRSNLWYSLYFNLLKRLRRWRNYHL